jgi:hypothetical protein
VHWLVPKSCVKGGHIKQVLKLLSLGSSGYSGSETSKSVRTKTKSVKGYFDSEVRV